MLFLTGLVLLLASGALVNTTDTTDTASIRCLDKPEMAIAVSTNLPYDLTYFPGYGITSIPSLGVEYYPSGHKRFSFGLDFECPFWAHYDTHRFLQANNLTLSSRWYFQKGYKGDYHGLFLYAGAGAARYGIGWDAHGWQGEGFHLSAGLGWKFALGRKSRFFMDMGLAGGRFHSRAAPRISGDTSKKE